MVILAFGIVPDLENHRTKATEAPAYCAKLFGIIVLLVDEVNLVKNLLCFRQADTVLTLDLPTLGCVEFEACRRI